MKIVLSKQERKNVATIVGQCCGGMTATDGLWDDISFYEGDFDDEDASEKILKYSKNYGSISPMSFDNSTMTLSLDDDGFKFLNVILGMAGLDLLEDTSFKNPSGLIFNIKVKK